MNAIQSKYGPKNKKLLLTQALHNENNGERALCPNGASPTDVQAAAILFIRRDPVRMTTLLGPTLITRIGPTEGRCAGM